jgi:hypothetical protein
MRIEGEYLPHPLGAGESINNDSIRGGRVAPPVVSRCFRLLVGPFCLDFARRRGTSLFGRMWVSPSQSWSVLTLGEEVV